MSGTSSDSITHDINYSKVIGKCPEIDITLGGIPVRCLYDSGSQVTTITNAYYEQHFKDQTLVDCRSLIRLTGAANGLEIPLIGLMICDVVMNSQTFKNAHILVVKDPQDSQWAKNKTRVPGIIGCNIIGQIYEDTITKWGSLRKQPETNTSIQQILLNYETNMNLKKKVNKNYKIKKLIF